MYRSVQKTSVYAYAYAQHVNRGFVILGGVQRGGGT